MANGICFYPKLYQCVPQVEMLAILSLDYRKHDTRPAKKDHIYPNK